MSTKRLEKIYKLKKHPDNPRVIKDVKFNKLVKSIKEFPEMLNDIELKDELYKHICDNIVMEYESANSVVDEDVEFTDNAEIEDAELASVSNE